MWWYNGCWTWAQTISLIFDLHVFWRHNQTKCEEKRVLYRELIRTLCAFMLATVQLLVLRVLLAVVSTVYAVGILLLNSFHVHRCKARSRDLSLTYVTKVERSPCMQHDRRWPNGKMQNCASEVHTVLACSYWFATYFSDVKRKVRLSVFMRLFLSWR